MFCENGKTGFPNSKEAAIAAANLSKHDKKHKYSHYKCRTCGEHHVHTASNKNTLRTPKKLNKYPIKYTLTVSDENPISKKENKKKKQYYNGKKK